MKLVKSMVFLLIILLTLSSLPVAFGAAVHEVSRQDSLYQIARWYGVDVGELSQTNNLSTPFTIYPGQVVIVPEHKVRLGEKLYKVKAGDSLFTIASQFNTTPAEVSSVNGIGPELYVGQVLRIPQPVVTLPKLTETAKSMPIVPQKAPQKNAYYYNIPDLLRDFPGRIFLKGNSDKRQVALTFDDGPDSVYTPQILDLLSYHGVRATFFLRGDRVGQYPDVAQRILKEGHVLANHSWSHPDLRKLSPEAVRLQLTNTAAEIKKQTGVEPTLVRPPYGELTHRGMEELVGLGYYLINWSADSGDWQAQNRDQVLIGSIPNSKPGAIVLMHSAGGQGQSLMPTIEALPHFIYTLRVQGYSFVTVDQLLDLPAYKG